MLPTSQGSIRLFRVAGVRVFLHWSWFLVAVWGISNRRGAYESPVWNAVEYLSLFAIVLLHEFGHALACRQVGGQANQIVLWPFGGVAYVSPPQRPGAVLWSIAAGPLVNVGLAVVLTAALFIPSELLTTDVRQLVFAVWVINLGLLIFNILPVYPLDGGQMLRALLWFWLGRGRSLRVATIIGFVGVALLAALALYERSVWMGLLTAFIGTSCWQGWKQAQALLHLERLPRHAGWQCPACRVAPPQVAICQCGQCTTVFDVFASRGACPQCGLAFRLARCLECGAENPVDQWAPG